jgi:hypothetical protein
MANKGIAEESARGGAVHDALAQLQQRYAHIWHDRMSAVGFIRHRWWR